ncbi:hypothetical protein BDW67DRAFT_181666 [Aspergillus spinulosporus]
MALGVAVAAESVATAAPGVAATNIWNPAGWALGGVLIGASQSVTDQAVVVTWGCYKPIFVSTHIESAGLPNVEVENHLGERLILRGVALPWGQLRTMPTASMNIATFPERQLKIDQ